MEAQDEPTEYCLRHPKVETILHCYQCGVPICIKCARRTPVGYICQDCQRGRKQRFEKSKPMDYVVAGVLALILGGIASVLPVVGWFVIFLSPAAGGLIAEIIWRAVRRRYGRYLWLVVAGGIVFGALPALLLGLLQGIGSMVSGGIWGWMSVLWVGVHMVLAVGAVIARLRML